MKWGQHIFGDRYQYKSLGQRYLSSKLKRLGSKVDKSKDAKYRKIKTKLNKIIKRDAERYDEFKKELDKQKEQTQSNNKKISIKDLTDSQLRSQNERLRLENENYRLMQEYNSYKETRGKSKTDKVLSKIGNRILEPALIGGSKTVVQDLITKIGSSTNNYIDRSYEKMLFGDEYDAYKKEQKNNKKKK